MLTVSDISYKYLLDDEKKIVQLQSQFELFFRPAGAEYGPEKICLTAPYAAEKETIDNFAVRDSDIFLAGHPKSGTTWIEELVWLVANNLDYEGAKVNIYNRYYLLETKGIFGASMEVNNVSWPVTKDVPFIDKLENPRFIKTHLPWSLLPKQIQSGFKTPKIIVVARNPKDVCASYFHHVCFEGYKGTFEDFAKLFLTGRLNWGPFWKNVLSYWEKRNNANVLFIKYEDMKEDLESVIKTVGVFFGKQLDDKAIKHLKEHLSFDSMKNNSAVNHDHYRDMLSGFNLPKAGNHFWRKGQNGTYKEIMSPELIAFFDMWAKLNTMDTGLSL